MSEFDPNAYLKARLVTPTASSGFDPDAYLKKKSAADAEEVPLHEAILGRASATVPFAKTIGAAIMTPFASGGTPARLTEKAKEELARMGLPIPEEAGVGSTFRFLKKAGEQRRQAGAEQHPYGDMVGTGLGIAASMALPAARAAQGVGVVGRLLPAAATAAGYGAANSFENSPGELTQGDFGQVAKDTVGVSGLKNTMAALKEGKYGRAALDFMGSGAIGGGVTGGLVAGAIEGVRRPLAGALRALGISKGKDVIQGGSDIAAASRKPLSDASVEEVLKSKLMGGTTGETYVKIDNGAAQLGDKYGHILSELERMGVKGPEAEGLARKYLARAEEIAPNTFDDASIQAFKDAAGKLREKAPKRGHLPQDYPEEMRGWTGGTEPGELGLKQTEGLKRSAQDAARLDRLKNSSTQESWEEIGSMTRQANEDAIARAADMAGPGSEIAQTAAEFVPTKQRLGRLLEARGAAERGAVKAGAKSSGPGLPDFLLGSAAGNPASAYITALASRSLRSRFPAAMARASYGASGRLSSGATQTALAKIMALLAAEKANEQNQPPVSASAR